MNRRFWLVTCVLQTSFFHFSESYQEEFRERADSAEGVSQSIKYQMSIQNHLRLFLGNYCDKSMRQCRRNGIQNKNSVNPTYMSKLYFILSKSEAFVFKFRFTYSREAMEYGLFKFPRRAHWQEILQLAMLNVVSLSDVVWTLWIVILSLWPRENTGITGMFSWWLYFSHY